MNEDPYEASATNLKLQFTHSLHVLLNGPLGIGVGAVRVIQRNLQLIDVRLELLLDAQGFFLERMKTLKTVFLFYQCIVFEKYKMQGQILKIGSFWTYLEFFLRSQVGKLHKVSTRDVNDVSNYVSFI